MVEQERCCFKLVTINTVADVFVCFLERFFCHFRVLFRVCSFSQFFQSYLTIFVNVVNVKLHGEGSYVFVVFDCAFSVASPDQNEIAT